LILPGFAEKLFHTSLHTTCPRRERSLLSSTTLVILITRTLYALVPISQSLLSQKQGRCFPIRLCTVEQPIQGDIHRLGVEHARTTSRTLVSAASWCRCDVR